MHPRLRSVPFASRRRAHPNTPDVRLTGKARKPPNHESKEDWTWHTAILATGTARTATSTLTGTKIANAIGEAGKTGATATASARACSATGIAAVPTTTGAASATSADASNSAIPRKTGAASARTRTTIIVAGASVT